MMIPSLIRYVFSGTSSYVFEISLSILSIYNIVLLICWLRNPLNTFNKNLQIKFVSAQQVIFVLYNCYLSLKWSQIKWSILSYHQHRIITIIILLLNYNCHLLFKTLGAITFQPNIILFLNALFYGISAFFWEPHHAGFGHRKNMKTYPSFYFKFIKSKGGGVQCSRGTLRESTVLLSYLQYQICCQLSEELSDLLVPGQVIVDTIQLPN